MIIDKVATGKHAYITTPVTCAKGGRKFTAKFDYTEGTSKTLTARPPCTRK
jgi:hypothetical protein